jgi:hypothetical protein
VIFSCAEHIVRFGPVHAYGRVSLSIDRQDLGNWAPTDTAASESRDALGPRASSEGQVWHGGDLKSSVSFFLEECENDTLNGRNFESQW